MSEDSNNDGGIKWGAEIAVDGKRPEWLEESDVGLFENAPNEWIGGEKDLLLSWQWHEGLCPLRIRLPADHPYYLATSRGFTYWPGGESAPEGWDGGETLKRAGHTWNTSDPNGSDWQRGYAGDASCMSEYDIIGYRKRTEQPASAIAPELVERMVALVKKMAPIVVPANTSVSECYAEARAILKALEPIDPDLLEARRCVVMAYEGIGRKDLALQADSGKMDSRLRVQACLSAIKRGRELEKNA